LPEKHRLNTRADSSQITKFRAYARQAQVQIWRIIRESALDLGPMLAGNLWGLPIPLLEELMRLPPDQIDSFVESRPLSIGLMGEIETVDLMIRKVLATLADPTRHVSDPADKKGKKV
jgi:hypothetical protein